jgi:hypothetical protein
MRVHGRNGLQILRDRVLSEIAVSRALKVRRRKPYVVPFALHIATVFAELSDARTTRVDEHRHGRRPRCCASFEPRDERAYQIYVVAVRHIEHDVCVCRSGGDNFMGAGLVEKRGHPRWGDRGDLGYVLRMAHQRDDV